MMSSESGDSGRLVVARHHSWLSTQGGDVLTSPFIAAHFKKDKFKAIEILWVTHSILIFLLDSHLRASAHYPCL